MITCPTLGKLPTYCINPSHSRVTLMKAESTASNSSLAASQYELIEKLRIKTIVQTHRIITLRIFPLIVT